MVVGGGEGSVWECSQGSGRAQGQTADVTDVGRDAYMSQLVLRASCPNASRATSSFRGTVQNFQGSPECYR
eukprot:682832-Rhodomonas_salina.1